MELNELQKTVDEWVSNPNFSVKYFPPFEICAQLTEESGEVCREIAHLHGHKKKKDGEETDGLESEIGDVLFVLACLANSHGIDLAESFRKSFNKKTGRDSKRFLK
jgi:NTP pyrophosphatase (non-canonical NTP hydrolase)